MARFRQTFRVHAPLSAVWKLHEDPQSLIALTPPPVTVKILMLEQPLHKGSRLTFRLSVGPVGAAWHVVYDEFDPYQPGMLRCGFADRSLKSPFHFWTHHHILEDAGGGTSTVTDDATFELGGGPLGKLVTALAWPSIAFLFLFRRYKTRRMLASGLYSG